MLQFGNIRIQQSNKEKKMIKVYWEQWDKEDGLSMCALEDYEEELNTEEEPKDDCCDRCAGSGCNYCLMCDY